MPTYIFKCSKCDEQFELLLSVRERESKKPACPKCKGKKVTPVITAFFAKTSRKS